MRVDLLLESVSVLSSLWGSALGVCSANLTLLNTSRGAGSRPLAATSVTAFIDVTVVPMDTERVIPNQTVVVAGGRIAALGPVNQVQVPAGAFRVDGRGKYLMPGLGDMHLGGGHTIAAPKQEDVPAYADGLFFRYVGKGVTSVRSLGKGNDRLQDLRRIAAEFPIPRPYIARMFENSMLTKPDSIAAFAAAAKAAGFDHLSTQFEMKPRSPAELAGFDSMIAAARRVQLPLSTHSHNAALEIRLAAGAAGGSTEHLPALRDLGIKDKSELDPAKLSAYVAAAKRSGIWMTPTLGCIEGFYGPAERIRRVTKALHDAGVKLLLGGDDGHTVHDELLRMVAAGLTPYQAFLTGTRNVAEYFGRLDSAGTVAVGKWADLLLLSGNPLVNVRYAREPAGVMVAGRWFDEAALDQAVLSWITRIQPSDGTRTNFFLAVVGKQLDQININTFDQLTDSLAAAESRGSAGQGEREQVLRRLTAELGTIRAGLSPDQQQLIDVGMRMWLRVQTRKGYQVAIPGVSPMLGERRDAR